MKNSSILVLVPACGYYRFQAGKIDGLDLDVINQTQAGLSGGSYICLECRGYYRCGLAPVGLFEEYKAFSLIKGSAAC